MQVFNYLTMLNLQTFHRLLRLKYSIYFLVLSRKFCLKRQKIADHHNKKKGTKGKNELLSLGSTILPV